MPLLKIIGIKVISNVVWKLVEASYSRLRKRLHRDKGVKEPLEPVCIGLDPPRRRTLINRPGAVRELFGA